MPLQVLSEKKIGIVAHFYMDPEVQGVLSQAGEQWPHIGISDSLLMADRAVKMAEQGCKAVAVLGVDFMSENVRAILDEAGHRDVQVCFPSATARCIHAKPTGLPITQASHANVHLINTEYLLLGLLQLEKWQQTFWCLSC